MKYKAVIFDFFGVISGEVAQSWFEKHFPGDDVRSKKEEVVAPADRGQISYDHLLVDLSKMSGIPTERIREEWQGYISIDPRMVELIKESKECGRRTALASDASDEFLRPILKANALEKLFDVIVVSSQIGSMKRDGKMFEVVLEALSVSPSEAFFIDDNPINIEAARCQGIEGMIYGPEKGIEEARKILFP